MAEEKVQIEGHVLDKKAQLAWGGIGGSGRHAAELMAEIADNPRISRAVEDLARMKGVDDLISRPGAAWGGIGGSGKHALDIEPEER